MQHVQHLGVIYAPQKGTETQSAPATSTFGDAKKLVPLSSTSTQAASTIKKANVETSQKNITTTQIKMTVTKRPTSSAKVSMPGALVVATKPTPTPETTTPTSPPPPPSVTPPSPDVGTPSREGALNQADIFAIVNKERNAALLPSLTFNKRLSAIAEIKALDMINKQYFAHVAPDGTDIAALAKRYAYQYINLGENLAMGDFVSSNEVMIGWMNSPGHKANILNKNYTEIGISAVEGYYEGHYIWFAVQEFGRPMSACTPTDATLKVTIDAEEATLSHDEAQLASYKSQLSSGNLSHDEYNAIVATYNALVDEYNALVGKTKQDVSIYNDSVNAFNACVGVS